MQQEKNYHSYLRTFCGDFMDVDQANNTIKAPAPTNVSETEDRYRIQVALPGFHREQIHLEVEEDLLKIEAEVIKQKKEGSEKFHKQEIFSSSFRRTILLPENVNDENITASFSDGLLNIDLPKSEHPVKSKAEIFIR